MSGNAYGSGRIAPGVADATQSVATSGLFKKYGNLLGGSFSLLWTVLAIYSFYHIHGLDQDDHPRKNYYWISPIILLILVIVANIYYFNAKNKVKDNDNEQTASINTIYANILLIPIYLIVIGICVLLIISK